MMLALKLSQCQTGRGVDIMLSSARISTSGWEVDARRVTCSHWSIAMASLWLVNAHLHLAAPLMSQLAPSQTLA